MTEICFRCNNYNWSLVQPALDCIRRVLKCLVSSTAVGSGLSLTFDLRERESNIHLLEQQLRERLDQCMPRPSARKQLFHGATTNYNNQSRLQFTRLWMNCDIFINILIYIGLTVCCRPITISSCSRYRVLQPCFTSCGNRWAKVFC